ncbi:hypothetical protein E2C01_009545 [Portunus trituberculatus]|uniref:Uncharacterized protein n=1 Tax=Portunus trituberculatus TaxID=210409 RepID=A0A5B7D629_PORTR|nr:hypothetical protein [Portunus trituberculatus]
MLRLNAISIMAAEEVWSHAATGPLSLITLVSAIRSAITEPPPVDTGMVTTLELIFSTNCAIVFIAPIPAVSVPVADKSDVNTVPIATSELKILVTVLPTGGRLITQISAVWLAVTHSTLCYASAITTLVHGVRVASTPAWFITSIPAVWIPITHSVDINACSVPTGVVSLWVTGTLVLIRFISAVNPAIASHTDIQASAIIAAEVKGRVTCAVAVTFIRVVWAVIEAITVTSAVYTLSRRIGTCPLMDVITRQLIYCVGVKHKNTDISKHATLYFTFANERLLISLLAVMGCLHNRWHSPGIDGRCNPAGSYRSPGHHYPHNKRS